MRAIALFAALAAIVTFPACTSDTAAGTYSVTIDTTGMPEPAAKMVGEMMKFGDCVLNEDGTWSATAEMSVMGETTQSSTKGTWKLAGGELEMTATEQDGEKMETPDVKKAAYKDGSFAIEMEGATPDQKFKMVMKKK